MVHRLKVQVARRAQLGLVGLVAAIGHEVDAKLALGGLDGGIDLAFGHVEALGVKLEMVNECLHRGLHVTTLGRRQLATGQDVALTFRRAQLGNRLVDDRDRLAHLFHADEVAVIAVAVLAHGDLELELVVAFVGLRTAQVPGQPRSAHHDAGKAPVEDLFFRHHADIGIALLEDAVFGQQPVDIGQHVGEMVGPFLDIVDQRGRQVLVHAAGPEIGRVQARAAGAFVEDHQLLAFLEAPERRRQSAHVHGLRGDVQQVVQDAPDLRVEHADQAGAARHLHPRQLLDRQAPGMFLVHRRHVVEPVQVGQVLQVGARFHQLLGPAMQQADMRVAAFHDLAVQFQHQAQHAVGRRVLRSEVDVEVPDLLFARQGVFEAFAAIHHASASMLSVQRAGSGPIRVSTAAY